ncbi:MAG: phospholipase A [Bacteroidota bacterium]
MKRTLISGIFIIIINAFGLGQTASEYTIFDSCQENIFSLYKENYITSGTDLSSEAFKDYSSDVKFHISVKCRFHNDPIKIFNKASFIYLTYTQKSFWDIFRDSGPFKDNNYNPGLCIRGNDSEKKFSWTWLGIEHESNGLDGPPSRSWNKMYSDVPLRIRRLNSFLFLKLWFPFGIGSSNNDMLDYIGFGELALKYPATSESNFHISIKGRKGLSGTKGNLIMDTMFKIRADKGWNVGLYFQWYIGYGENLLEYDQNTNRLRAGVIFTPNNFTTK